MDPQAFLEGFLADQLVAGSPSFDVKSSGGDARRARKGLSPSDVQRLIEANPDFADQIREMYLPGASLPTLKRI